MKRKAKQTQHIAVEVRLSKHVMAVYEEAARLAEMPADQIINAMLALEMARHRTKPVG